MSGTFVFLVMSVGQYLFVHSRINKYVSCRNRSYIEMMCRYVFEHSGAKKCHISIHGASIQELSHLIWGTVLSRFPYLVASKLTHGVEMPHI